MERVTRCPVCGKEEWVEVSRHKYRLSRGEVEYLELRRRVMFECWWIGRTEVELIAQSCSSCGFVCYSPRPSSEDLMAKYMFLREHETLGAAHAAGRRTHKLLSLRLTYLQEAIRRVAKRRPDSVLDIGGGDGRLLQPFLELGSKCFVVDFNESPIAGVSRLGTQLEEISSDRIFDLIICSHVLEHVAEPTEMLRNAKRLLSNNGLIYVEVPLEIWKGIPIDSDPVTHINFFTTKVLKSAIAAAGLSPILLERRIAPYGPYYMRVVSVVAAHGDAQPDDSDGASEVLALVNPPLWRRCCRGLGDIKIDLLLNAPFRAKALVAAFMRVS
jgi:SAM-dependent methyltransferase